MSTLGILNVIVFPYILFLGYCLLRFSRELSSKRGSASDITCSTDYSESMRNLSSASYALAYSSALARHFPLLRIPFTQAINPKPVDMFGTQRGNSTQVRDMI